MGPAREPYARPLPGRDQGHPGPGPRPRPDAEGPGRRPGRAAPGRHPRPERLLRRRVAGRPSGRGQRARRVRAAAGRPAHRRDHRGRARAGRFVGAVIRAGSAWSGALWRRNGTASACRSGPSRGATTSRRRCARCSTTASWHRAVIDYLGELATQYEMPPALEKR